MMYIKHYEKKYENQTIALVLYLQNYDNYVDLSINDQPDLKDITSYYSGLSRFWVAVDEKDHVRGTIGFIAANEEIGILKKFFVHEDYRGSLHGISKQLFEQLVQHAKTIGLHTLILDSPKSCVRAHAFYHKSGFTEISRNDLPLQYDYPDRDSVFFKLAI